jgi:hypothetical protein
LVGGDRFVVERSRGDRWLLILIGGDRFLWVMNWRSLFVDIWLGAITLWCGRGWSDRSFDI